MAFCPKCGHELAGGQRFCPQCGSDVAAAAAATADPTAAASAVSAPTAGPPSPIAAPAPAVGSAKKGTTRIVAVVVAVVLVGAYLYNRSHTGTTQTGTQPTPGAPGGSPAGPNSGLAAQQWLPVQWQNEGGTITITGSWTNNSRVTIGSASVECDQTDNGGNLVVRNNLTIGGPLPPNSTRNLMRVRVGTMSPQTTMVSCRIVGVTVQLQRAP